MALMKLGIVATDARGSVAGTVFSRNRAGAYTRARVKPINPRTPAQSLVRANFGVNAKAWSGNFTADQRAAWTFFAQANPQVNRLGDSIILSGLSMQQKLNQVLTQIGSANISDPPPDMSVSPIADAIGTTSVAGLAAVIIQTNAQIAGSGTVYYIKATGPLAPGKKPQLNQYRYVTNQLPEAAATTVDITTAWQAVFGSLIAGKVIGVSVQQVNTATGASTAPLYFQSLTAP